MTGRPVIDAEKLRAWVKDNPDPTFSQALADYDLFAAKGERPVLYVEHGQLVVGTLEPLLGVGGGLDCPVGSEIKLPCPACSVPSEDTSK